MKPGRKAVISLEGYRRSSPSDPRGRARRKDVLAGGRGAEASSKASVARAVQDRRGQLGLSLFEFVLGLVFVAILGAVGIARYSNLNADAISDAETLKSNLRYAHTRAMTDIYTWQLQVDGQTCTVQRNAPTPKSYTFTFSTAGVAPGTTTFDNRGKPSGTMSYEVVGYPQTPVTITTETGFVP